MCISSAVLLVSSAPENRHMRSGFVKPEKPRQTWAYTAGERPAGLELLFPKLQMRGELLTCSRSGRVLSGDAALCVVVSLA